MSPSINERAIRCQKAIATYGDDLSESNLIDLLADAMHWCDDNEENFHYLLCMAGKHYLAELNDEPTYERRMP